MFRDRIHRAIARTLAVVAPLTLIVAFQNCTSAKPGALDNGSRAKAENGNGNGYGGMQYFAARNATTLCADGTDIRSRIAVTGSQNSYLTRENCKEIAPTRVNVNFTATADVPALSYEGQVFHGEQSQPQPVAAPSPTAGRAPASSPTTVDLSGNLECTATELGRADSKATIRLARRSAGSESGRIYSHRGSLKVQTAGSIKEYEGFRVERLAPLVLISEGSKGMRSLLLTLNGEQLPATGVMNFSVDGRTKTFRINGCQ